MNLSIGILSGGKSSRMGQDKAGLKLRDKSFIETLSQELSCFSELIISADRLGKYEYLGFPVVCDEHKDIGPIEGIYRLLKASSSDYMFITAVDTPFITHKLVEYISEFISGEYDCCCIRDNERIHPLCAIYSKKQLPEIERLIDKGSYRLRELLDNSATKYINIEYSAFDKKLLQNINTMEEYREALRPFIFCVSGIKNSGKTTLIRKLIGEFTKASYKVAVIKHDGHSFEMDHEGTDTYSFSAEGAVCSSIFSKGHFALNIKKDIELTRLIELVKAASDPDIIIIEGMKDSKLPKLEVVRKGISESSVCRENTLIAIVSDVLSPADISCPVYDFTDIEKIRDCVLQYHNLLLLI